MSRTSYGGTVDVAQPIEILLVEDSAPDAELTRIALRDAKVTNQLHIVRDGQDAMDFLRQVGRFSGAPRPDLILLDLNLPRKSGHEILAEVRQDPQLELIPVVVLTTSSDEHDVFRSYGLRANAYITKPVDFGQFRKVIQAIDEFWFEIVRLPKL